jgi:flagellar brake protein
MRAMPPTTPARIPVFELDRRDLDSKYLLTTPNEVLACLYALAQGNTVVSAYLDSGETFFLTGVIAVDEKNRTFLIDAPNNPQHLAAALAAKRLTLTASLNRVKIEIRPGNIRAGEHQGLPCLIAAIPERIVRMQRREFFRVEPLVSQPAHCLVTLPGSNSGEIQLPVVDVSAGGLGLLGKASMQPDFTPGLALNASRLQIPEAPELLVDLRVCKAFLYAARNGLEHLHIGCEFVNLSIGRQSQVDRYIARLERERKSRQSRLG